MKQSSSKEVELGDDIRARSMCTRARVSNCLTLRIWSKATVSRFGNNLFPVRDWPGVACPARHGGSESVAMSRLMQPQEFLPPWPVITLPSYLSITRHLVVCYCLSRDWSFSNRTTFLATFLCPRLLSQSLGVKESRFFLGCKWLLALDFVTMEVPSWCP